MEGYIKIFRQIRGHWLFKERRKFSRFEAWLDLLMIGAWKDHEVLLKGQLYTVCRGDVVWSQRELAKHWCWSEKKLRNFLRMLEKSSMIRLHTRPHRITQLSIVNYERYQNSELSGDTTECPTEDARKAHESRRTIKGKKGKNISPKQRKTGEDIYA